MNDCGGLLHKVGPLQASTATLRAWDIYCHFEVRIYPDSPKEEVKLKWKDILGENLSRPGTVKVISALILSSIMNLSKIPSSIRLGQELGTGSHNS
jgi:hypothetical protein